MRWLVERLGPGSRQWLGDTTSRQSWSWETNLEGGVDELGCAGFSGSDHRPVCPWRPLGSGGGGVLLTATSRLSRVTSSHQNLQRASSGEKNPRLTIQPNRSSLVLYMRNFHALLKTFFKKESFKFCNRCTFIGSCKSRTECCCVLFTQSPLGDALRNCSTTGKPGH